MERLHNIVDPLLDVPIYAVVVRPKIPRIEVRVFNWDYDFLVDFVRAVRFPPVVIVDVVGITRHMTVSYLLKYRDNAIRQNFPLIRYERH
ncbi:hypothetical protein D1872_252240 [compost metagenome]